MGWVVYILRCGDSSLYTGITDDLERRFAAHQAGKGAKYTRGRGPLTVEYCLEVANRPAALREERRIKKLSRRQKEQLIIEAQFAQPQSEKNQQ
ncbi:MAG: GIY-YIG nuclease family protein [Acidobacteria bacterium]|nr:GIY-YIG nuclease family protein [Acidobacteriota bacterium]